MPTSLRSWRRSGVVLVAGCLAALVVVLSAGPASAHAALVVSDPRDGAVLDTSPTTASFTFNEAVEVTVGAVRVFDANGDRVDDGTPRQPAADQVIVGLDDLPDGGYVATYRVTSEDGHVIRGALTFRVGAGAALDDATVAALFGGGDGALGIVGTVVRAVDLGAVLVAVGALATLFGMVARAAHRRLARATASTAARVGIMAALVAVPVQAMATSGLGLSALGSGAVWTDTLTSTVGLSALTRVAGLVLVLAVVAASARADEPGTGADDSRAGRGAGGWAGVGAALLALGSLLVDGHTRTVSPQAVMLVGDVVHVTAGALWAGGLLVLARVLRHDREHLPDAPEAVPTGDPVAAAVPSGAAVDTAGVVARFSGRALWSMLALVAAGLAMGWALVRQPRALTSTDQGWTLVVKVSLVLVVLVIAAWNRWRLVPAVTARGGDATAARSLLRSSVRLEVALVVAVLATTAVMVGLRPAAAEAGISGAFDTVVALDDTIDLNLVVDPNRAGRNELHVYVLDATGRPLSDATDVTLSLEQPGRDIGPIERTPLVAGPGHWVLDGSDLAVPGTWTVTTIVGLDRFTRVAATVEVVVNPG